MMRTLRTTAKGRGIKLCTTTAGSYQEIDISGTKPMQSIRSNLGLLMAGSYGLITSVVLYLSLKSPQSLPLFFAAILLTLPWSIVVALFGFLLIHISTHGMDYGFIFGAVLNTLSLFVLGRKLAKAKEGQERV
jgi:uncharacterized BrkB/YihY/UPF0761 family membrane protein